MRSFNLRWAGPPAICLALAVASPPAALAGVSVIHAVPTAPAVAPPAGSVADDDPAAELARARAEARKAYESINRSNPMSGDFAPGSEPVPGSPQDPLAKLQTILSHPAVRGYLSLFSDPAFAQAVEQVMGSPERLHLLYAEIGFALFMLVFRAWRFSKCTHWARRLWTNAWTFGLYWAGAVAAVPCVVIGKPYYRMLAGLASAASRAWIGG